MVCKKVIFHTAEKMKLKINKVEKDVQASE